MITSYRHGKLDLELDDASPFTAMVYVDLTYPRRVGDSVEAVLDGALEGLYEISTAEREWLLSAEIMQAIGDATERYKSRFDCPEDWEY